VSQNGRVFVSVGIATPFARPVVVVVVVAAIRRRVTACATTRVDASRALVARSR